MASISANAECCRIFMASSLGGPPMSLPINGGRRGEATTGLVKPARWSGAQLRTGECVADRRRGGEAGGLAGDHAVEQHEQGRVEGIAGEGRRLAAEVGTGR